MKVLTIADTIIKLLEKHPHLRDNDSKLLAWIWDSEFRNITDVPPESVKLPRTVYERFLSAISIGELTRAESITRARRKIQEEFPHLRGTVYHHRQAEQEPVKKELGYKTPTLDDFNSDGQMGIDF